MFNVIQKSISSHITSKRNYLAGLANNSSLHLLRTFAIFFVFIAKQNLKGLVK